MKSTFIILSIAIMIGSLNAGKLEIPDFISDTVMVIIPGDSLIISDHQGFVVDNRGIDGRLLAVSTKKKWHYIPVDQFYLLNHSLAVTVNWFLGDSIISNQYRLYIDDLTFWFDHGGFINKGNKLNGYTRLVSPNGETIRDWQWDFTARKKKKQPLEEIYSRLMVEFLTAQVDELGQSVPDQNKSRNRYRRELNPWVDYIILEDGFIIDGRLTLRFPKDERKKWSFGIKEIYYRRSKKMESASIGGFDQQWFWRKNDSIVLRTGFTGRLGFNSYRAEYFDTIHWKNIFMINAGILASIEYRPRYLQGFHGALGLYTQLNVLPDLVDRVEGGLLMSVGINLP